MKTNKRLVTSTFCKNVSIKQFVIVVLHIQNHTHQKEKSENQILT